MGSSSPLADADVTDREAEVFALLAERLTHAQIAARLFVSIRTIESHVASLRRKLGVAGHRELIELAVRQQTEAASGHRLRISALPIPLTSFVGRGAELAALNEALAESRLVSAVGPGGVGKTRLAVELAVKVAERFPGGVAYVDLVPVTDPALVASAVSAALGVRETSRLSTEDGLVASVGDHAVLVVLDNCEHVVNRAVTLVELLLSRCGNLRILVTSRTRLVVPFERVYQVPGLSLPESGDGVGDAVALFIERAGAVGARVSEDDQPRVAAICRAVDAGALAIELAAARLPSLGLDGLERGLGRHLGLLTGGARLQQRHRSLQDTLDWSYLLLDPVEQAVLRRVSVFAAPFDPDAAAEIADADPVPRAEVLNVLVRLAEHSLLVPVPDPTGTRYRALETVRQYGAARLAWAGDCAHARHLRWCLAAAARLDSERSPDLRVWTAAFDSVADDLRAALGWEVEQPDHRGDAHRLALLLAGLLFRRGRAGEAQCRYEAAAQLADAPALAASALESAPAVAKCRVLGPEALRFERAAADAHLRAGNPDAAARSLARSAEFVNRFQGMFTHQPATTAAETLVAEARRYATGDRRAAAAILLAKANAVDPRDPVAAELAERSLELARRVADPLLESGALDLQMLLQVIHLAVVDAAATVRRRVELLNFLPLEPAVAFELKDALHSAVFTAVGAGDLRGAHLYARQHVDLPFLREERDLAVEDALYPYALAGDFDRVLALGRDYRDGWERAGRATAPGRGLGAAAVAMVHGIRGDQGARAEWLAILATIRGVDAAHATSDCGYGEVFDAITLLHQQRPAAAFGRLDLAPETLGRFFGQLFHQWIAALRAEAAVLAGQADAATHLERAAAVVADNPIATAVLHRAQALLAADRAALAAVAAEFAAAASPYQQARTLALAGTK